MRTDNTIKNAITAMTSSIIQMILGFIAQAIFIKQLGTEYVGLNGLFTNILSMLSFFELGIGSAIVYHLYKPIAEKDIERIKLLMNFYKKSYRTISILIFMVGILVIPFLNKVVGQTTIEINIYIVYIIYLINSSSSYLLIYKRNLIQANQKSYIINIVHIIYLIILNIAQIIILIITRNYYLYLVAKFICQLLENIVCSIIVSNMYPFVNEKCINNLDKNTSNDIVKKIKALVFHKMGWMIVNGTDNIIISYFLGIETVGLYSNYYLIINAVNNLFNQIITSATASIGNMLTGKETAEKKYNVFNRIQFLNFMISCFSAICILVIISPFIKIWIGEQYLLSTTVTIILVLNYFQKMQRHTYNTFKDAAGIWYEDRFAPIIEAILNIVFSIILLKKFGLEGVFMGTIVSALSIWCYSYPKYVYKKLFNRTYLEYAKETLGYIAIFIVLALVTYYLSTLITFNNIWMQLISNTIISITIPNIILFLIFRKTDNFKYFLNLLNKYLHIK